MRIAFAVLAVVVTAAVVYACGGGDGEVPAQRVQRPVLTGTAADIPVLERAVRSGRDDLRTDLAQAYLQRVRETADPSNYAKASKALGTPRTANAFATAAQIAAAKHEFSKALQLAGRAGTAGEPIKVDALVELGRLDEAERVLQAMIDRRPNLAGYARVSYVRELHGDLDGAVEAMRLAIAAGGPSAENGAYVTAVLGELERRRGRLRAARGAFEQALALVPTSPEAQLGLARLDAQRGRLGPAIERLRRLVARRPDLDALIALGEAERAAGKPAQRTFERVAAKRATITQVNADSALSLVAYEADYGDPRQAVQLARFAYAQAPSTKSADALGWALTRAGEPDEGRRYAREALRDGAVDPLWLAHAGLAERAAGGDGRRELRRALAHGLDGYPGAARKVRRALA